jgi:hypothetical protein
MLITQFRCSRGWFSILHTTFSSTLEMKRWGSLIIFSHGSSDGRLLLVRYEVKNSGQSTPRCFGDKSWDGVCQIHIFPSGRSGDGWVLPGLIRC